MVVNKCICSIVSILFFFSAGKAQELASYVPISPNAASLSKYGSYPVNKNKGVPKISIPLFEISQGDLSVPITLQYHASGIRINEIGSWVGLGWSLNAGGDITRKVNGIPDEFAPNNGDILNKIGVIPNFDTLEFNALFYNYFFDVIQGASDTSPDEYYYNFGHFTGKYIKNPEGFLFNKYEPLRINTADETITITTDNGSNYLFEEEGFETTKIFPHLTCNISKSNPTYQELHDTEISSKKLTKIINSNATDTIHFNYRDNAHQPTSYLSGQSIVYNFTEEVRINDSYTPVVTLTEKILEEIVFNSGKIVFESDTDREDSGSSRLNCIYIYDINNRLVDKIKFNYSYFDRSSGYAKTCQYHEDYSIDKSIKLEYIEQGIANPKVHTFTYNNTPLSIRGSTAQDYWGYSNANTNTSFIPEQTVTLYNQGDPIVAGSITPKEETIGAGTKEADEERMKAATLIRIDYPTGGYTEFEYEPNYYETVEQIPITQSFSESISAVGYTGDPNNDYCSPNSGVKVTKSFLPGPSAFDANIRINLSDASAERSAASSSYVNIDGMYLELPEVLKTRHLRPSSIGLDYYPSYDFSSNVLFGSGYSNNFYNGVTIEAQEFGEGFAYRASSCPYASIRVSWKEIIGFEEKTVKKYTGGLRIKSISGFTSDTNLATKKLYNYKSLHEILAVNKDTRIRHSTAFTPISLRSTIASSEIVNSSVDMGASTEYLEVEEIQIDEQGNQNGKIITYYHATPVIRNLDNRWTNFGYRAHDNLDSRCYPYQTLLLAMQGPLNWTDFKISTWSSGLVRKEETYKFTPTDTLLVSKIENSYETLMETEIPVNRVLTITNLEHSGENDWRLCSNNSSKFIYAQGFFSLGKKALRSSTQTQYDLNGENPVVTIENYQYDNSHFLSTETETADSQSNRIKTKTYYPG